MSPRIYMDLVEALMFKGYSYDDAGPLAYELMSDPESIVDIPDFVGPPRSDDLSMQAEGGRVGMQEGGTPGYDEIVKTIMESVHLKYKDFSVPLTVDFGAGDHWGQAH